MHALIKKIHMYIGLLNFSNLIVFGIAGLAPTFQTGPERKIYAEPVRYETFIPAPGSSDEQIANAVFAHFHFPFTDPIPKWALHRMAKCISLNCTIFFRGLPLKKVPTDRRVCQPSSPRCVICQAELGSTHR